MSIPVILPDVRGIFVAGASHFIVALIFFGEKIDQEILFYHSFFIWLPVVTGGVASVLVMSALFNSELRSNVAFEFFVNFIEFSVLISLAYTSDFYTPEIIPIFLTVPFWIVLSISIMVGWRCVYLIVITSIKKQKTKRKPMG